MKGGRLVMNLALFTYFIPAAFLAVPMYRTMGMYGLLNNDLAADPGHGDDRLALTRSGSCARPPTSCRSNSTRPP
jgi:hypothetical protein